MKKEKVLSIIFYCISILILMIYIIIELNNTLTISELTRIFLLCLSCLFLYFGGYELSKYNNNIKPMKFNLWVFFILYIILLLTLTLFDESWGRSGLGMISATDGNITEYLTGYTNLIPFKTIIEYIKEFNGLASTELVLFNLLGNFIAFMPFAFFLSLLFQKERKFKKFLLTMFLIILSIEFIQLIKSSGRFDIDDIILNLSGALLMFRILKINSINKLVRNIFLLENNKISKNDYLKIFISVIVIIALVVCLIKYKNSIYNKNLDDYMKINNPTLKIIDKTTSCDDEKEKFYENELFIYYYPCTKSDSMYVLINDEKEYLIQDILNADTFEYNIDLSTILESFDNNNIKYIKEEKYDKINLDMKMVVDEFGGFVSPNCNFEINDKSIISLIFDYENSNIIDDTYLIDLYIIPKSSGTASFEVSCIDSDSEKKIIESTYKVKVENNKKVSYEIID